MMTIFDLVPGKTYKMTKGDIAEFSRIGATGYAIFHPPGEPDMQSSFALPPDKIPDAVSCAVLEEADREPLY